MTAAAVCLPSGALKAIRRWLPRDLPKWRDATDDHVMSVVSLVRREAFGAVGRVVRKEAVRWEAFWRDAGASHASAVALSRETLGFIKAATQIRYMLLAEATAILAGHCIKSNRFPENRSGTLEVDEDHIYDAEVDGADNVAVFREIWDARNAHQPLAESLGLRMRARTIQFSTEQGEPLLLLPDYVAGVVHCAYSTDDTLSASRVSRMCAQAAYRELKAWPNFQDVEGDFDLDYFDILPIFRELGSMAGVLAGPRRPRA